MSLALNLEQVEAALKGELFELLKERKDALDFLKYYIDYCHMIDDLVDEDKNIELVRQTSKQAAIVFNCPYWKQWGANLYLVDRITHNTYFDSVVWEKSEEEWKRRDARALNHCAYNMLFAIILIEFGEAKLQEISGKYREFAHAKQLKEDGTI